MAPSKKRKEPRSIDKKVSSASKKLKSRFVLIPSVEVKTWKALIIIMFVTGFAAAIVWSAYNSWYIGSSAKGISASDVSWTGTTLGTPRAGACIKAGKVSKNGSLGPRGNFGICCKGLKEIDNGLVYNSKTQKCSPVEGAGVICSDCGNGKCEKWENPCNCAKDCGPKPPILKCKKAGEVVRNPSLGPADKPGQCCAGLKEIDTGLFSNGASGAISQRTFCDRREGAAIICSPCGNGKCDKGENRCNCSSDCK